MWKRRSLEQQSGKEECCIVGKRGEQARVRAGAGRCGRARHEQCLSVFPFHSDADVEVKQTNLVSEKEKESKTLGVVRRCLKKSDYLVAAVDSQI